MAGRSSRVIARIFSTYSTEYAELTWEWIMRADGQACYRLRELRGRREHNPWQPVIRLGGPNLRALAADPASAEAWLAGLAVERGHRVNGYRDHGGGADGRHGRRLPADAKQSVICLRRTAPPHRRPGKPCLTRH
jgi:hypothetical protein